MDSQRICTFYVGDLHFGLAVEHVQEILRHQELTPVPLSPHAVTGLLNLRGEVVTAIELRHVLDLGSRPQDREPSNVVVRTEEGVVSLLVDNIGDVLEVAESDFESVPRTLPAYARRNVRGVYKLTDGLLLELDIDRIWELGGGSRAGGNSE